jgi:hypothetical protein
MIKSSNDNSQYGITQTNREWELSDKIDNLFIEDAERV